MRTSLTLAAALAAALTLAGCASLPPGLTSPGQYSPTTYAPQSMQQAQQVQIGTILAIVPVTVRASGTTSDIGTGLGAAVGGLLGHSVGGGNGKTLATVAGAIAGGIGGGIATQHLYAQSALQITVRLSGCTGAYAGCTEAITQAASASQPLHVGQRVEIVAGNGWGGGAARVLPLN
ncbi:glycine zipper 2TM domain-containing protein [Metallibacterium sp.]|uniref:glycine zipper 2TM domain-containing protein n=1 Tax=Metallibacterium sp. TaxID=2940281 RepID=UPI002629C8D4|nr:glycine zipper 2TM domain-containing protein [Metallibacterium sp.]